MVHLGVEFGVQILAPSPSNIISKKGSVFVCHQLSVKSNSSPADLYQFYFTGYGKTSFSANPVASATKYVWIEQGELTVYLASKTLRATAGQAMTFNASIPHRFENRKNVLLKGVVFVAYDN